MTTPCVDITGRDDMRVSVHDDNRGTVTVKLGGAVIHAFGYGEHEQCRHDAMTKAQWFREGFEAAREMPLAGREIATVGAR